MSDDALIEVMVGAIVIAHRDEYGSIPTPKAAQSMATAALAALRQTHAVVPLEPTEAMTHAGACAVDHPSVYMGGPSHTGKRIAPVVYRAMLAASEEGL